MRFAKSGNHLLDQAPNSLTDWDGFNAAIIVFEIAHEFAAFFTKRNTRKYSALRSRPELKNVHLEAALLLAFPDDGNDFFFDDLCDWQEFVFEKCRS